MLAKICIWTSFQDLPLGSHNLRSNVLFDMIILQSIEYIYMYIYVYIVSNLLHPYFRHPMSKCRSTLIGNSLNADLNFVTLGVKNQRPLGFLL